MASGWRCRRSAQPARSRRARPRARSSTSFSTTRSIHSRCAWPTGHAVADSRSSRTSLVKSCAIDFPLPQGSPLDDGLSKNCRAEAPGIYFDFDAATLKPPSKPALERHRRVAAQAGKLAAAHRRPHRQCGRRPLQRRPVGAPGGGGQGSTRDRLRHRSVTADVQRIRRTPTARDQFDDRRSCPQPARRTGARLRRQVALSSPAGGPACQRSIC